MLVIQIKSPIEDNKKSISKRVFFFSAQSYKKLTKNKDYRAQDLGDGSALALRVLCRVAEETAESLRGLEMPSNWGSDMWSRRPTRGWGMMKPTHIRLGP